MLGRTLETLARQSITPGRAVIGVDDSGQGAIAGPTFAAAVWLPESWQQSGVCDSKLMSVRARSDAFQSLDRDTSVAWACAAIPALAVDAMGGQVATEAAMRLSVERLQAKLRRRSILSPGLDCYCLVDGDYLPEGLDGVTLRGGDAAEAAIAAASIVATAARDRCMAALARRHKLWSLGEHGGHPSTAHLRAIAQYGPCAEHRMSCFPFARRHSRGLAYHPHRREYAQVRLGMVEGKRICGAAPLPLTSVPTPQKSFLLQVQRMMQLAQLASDQGRDERAVTPDVALKLQRYHARLLLELPRADASGGTVAERQGDGSADEGPAPHRTHRTDGGKVHSGKRARRRARSGFASG